MKNSLFTIPFYPQRIAGWQQKKQMLLKELGVAEFVRNEYMNFQSDRASTQGNEYLGPFCNIFNEELNAFGSQLGAKSIEVVSIWTVIYGADDFHPVHNHRSHGFSGILYVDYDPAVHEPTIYVSPLNNPITDTTELYAPQVEEGDLIIFPSSILHYTRPTKTDKTRRIVSFDMDIQMP